MKRLYVLGVSLLFFGISLAPVYSQKVLTLDQALETAMQQSPQLQVVELSLAQQRNRLVAQRAGLKTKFSLDLNPLRYAKRRDFHEQAASWFNSENLTSSGQFVVSQPVLLTDGVFSLRNNFEWRHASSDLFGRSSTGEAEKKRENKTSYNDNLFLRYDQPLFTYNRTKLKLRELEYAYENAMIDYALRKLEVEMQVTRKFYALHELQMGVQTAEEELKNQQDSYDIIEGKVNAGLVAKEEFYQAEVNLAKSKSKLFQSKLSLANSLDEFKHYIGMSLYDDILVFADVYVTPVKVEEQDAVDKALANRMEIRKREIELANSQHEILRAEETNDFRGDLSVQVGLLGNGEKFRGIYDDPSLNQDYSLKLSVPIWDWGERKARRKVAEASVEKAELSFSEERIRITLSVRKVLREMQNLLNQIEIASQNVENAQRTFEISMERYKNGDLTSIDLDIQQRQLSQAKMSHTKALINYKNEVLNLKIQTLWDYEKNRSYFPHQVFENFKGVRGLKGFRYFKQ